MIKLTEITDEKSRNSHDISAKSDQAIFLNGRRFDASTKTLFATDGAPLTLRAQSMEVLAALVENEGTPVTKEKLFERVWPDAHVTDDSLVQCIADIRRALGDDDKTLIQTLPKIGYRLAIYAPTPRVRLGALPLVAGCLAMIAAALWLVWPTTETPILPEKPRIAVLAFDDFSTGDDKGYLSDAVAEGLITELARFPAMGVIARTSSFSYRDTAADIDTIRDELRVHYVLEGSQQKSGNRLKVTVQLIDTRSGDHVWAERFDRGLEDFFVVQEEIVRAVAAIVNDIVVFRPLPESDLAQVTAYNYFRQSIGNPDSREQVEKRLELGRMALEVDPDSVWGYLTMGWGHRHMAVFYSTPEEKPVHLAEAKKYADMAVEIAPQNYIAYWLRARVEAEYGDHKAAINTYDQGIAVNPSAANMLVGSSSPRLYMGQFEDALAIIDSALELDPKHTSWFHWQRAWALWELDRCEEALDAFGRMSKIPNAARRMHAATHACLGNKEEASASLKVFLDENPNANLKDERAKSEVTWPNPSSVEKWLKHMEIAGMPAE
ncbi:winged helix-turn-helix domain-containing tetratricopeptide repeat protein [Ruegeria hyattellae]|uniref:winged helix-turn-helix domain-containing tetratricopeptide repeat protein n=1 Tax=Ruegeria hyattellae TaxID=3233337 RepID=UPI00355B56B9